MLNMSFALTTPQVRSQEKDVTRRLGWDDLKPGDCACDSSPWFDADRCGICPHNLACDVPKNPNLYPF